MGKNTDQPGLEQLEKERFRIITDIIYYAAGHVDRMDFKYGCTLNRLVFMVRECIDIYDLAEVIQEDMLNTYSIVMGLVSDKYLMSKEGSRGKYDCVVTKKGKKIGMGRTAFCYLFFQRIGNMGLSNDVGKRFRPPFTVQRTVHRGAPSLS